MTGMRAAVARARRRLCRPRERARYDFQAK